jgi:hypothetical protein
MTYGLHIDTWVEISTVGEPNNAQLFSEPESLRFIASRTAAYVDRYDAVRIPWFTNLQRHLQEPKTLLRNWRIEEPEFLDS